VIGDLCSSKEQLARQLTHKHGLDVSIGYRYQPSSRHFIGTVEQKQRELANNQIQNVYHLIDVSVNYRLNRRWSLTASLPVVVARRDQLYVPTGTFRAAGIGDMSVGARAWIFRPPTESGGNIAVGLSLKMPTGNDSVTGTALDRNGVPITAVADQSIQLGDGGWGFALDVQAFKPTYLKSTLYFSGSYLFNPADTNGVPTFRTRPFEGVMSVSDQYLYRGGISHRVPKMSGLVASLGGRIEGVPVRDAFGASNGFRRPGYAISVDPGFLYSWRDYVFACNIPWAVERNRKISVPDRKNGTHGDAAFADYAITIGVTRRF
jgi:hypothetical protein